mgnify:CR=1 FL=1
MNAGAMRATCHCGAVELCVTLSEPISNARRYDCSFCAKRGAAVVFAAQGDVEILKGCDALMLYQWNTRQTDHYFCSRCGIFPHDQHDNPADGYAINVGALEGAHPKDHDPSPWIDGKNYLPDNHRKDEP